MEQAERAAENASGVVLSAGRVGRFVDSYFRRLMKERHLDIGRQLAPRRSLSMRSLYGGHGPDLPVTEGQT